MRINKKKHKLATFCRRQMARSRHNINKIFINNNFDNKNNNNNNDKNIVKIRLISQDLCFWKRFCCREAIVKYHKDLSCTCMRFYWIVVYKWIKDVEWHLMCIMNYFLAYRIFLCRYFLSLLMITIGWKYMYAQCIDGRGHVSVPMKMLLSACLMKFVTSLF